MNDKPIELCEVEAPVCVVCVDGTEIRNRVLGRFKKQLKGYEVKNFELLKRAGIGGSY